MLRLGRGVLNQLISSSSAASPVSHLHRCLSSAAAPGISPNPSFAVEDYLVGTCSLTPAQALNASTKLSHLKSPTKPDAVLAFLAGLGLSTADVAALVAKDPHFLCADVEKTLSPIVVGLTGHGLSHSQVARLVSVTRSNFRRRSIVSKLHYYLPLLGSYENLLRLLKRNNHLLSCSLEGVVEPNVALLRECGIHGNDIAKLCISMPRIITTDPERVRAVATVVQGLGVPRGSGMFRQMLLAVTFNSEDKIALKFEYLKKTFGWSDAQVSIAVSKLPSVLRRSKESLQRMSEFLISEVGLESGYIAHRPVILGLSLEGRLKPRYYVVKFLKENRLLVNHNWSYSSIFRATEKIFLELFICPHKEFAPHLAEAYVAACRGEVPISSRFTCSKNKL